jgi:drug/metabolite transporter (DMT)-like permease
MSVTVATREKDQTLAWVLLFVLALIWGSSFILIKKGVAVYTASQVGSLRILAAAVFMFPLAIMHFRKVPRNKWKYLFICGILGNLVPSFLFSFAGTQLNSSVSGTLNALTPLFTLLVGSLFFRQAISLGKMAGIITGFAGCVLLIAINAQRSFELRNSYAIYPVLATICYGVNANLIKKYLAGIKPLYIASLSLCSIGPLAGLYFFSSGIRLVTLQSMPGLTAMAYVLILGILGTAIATVFFNKIIQLAGPLFTSSVTYLIPVIALGWGLLDGENLIIYQYFSMAAIITGVYLVHRSK